MENQKVQSTPVEQQPTEQTRKNNEKGEKKERKQFKSEYVYDADAIKIDTEIPPLPKKSDLLKKPQFQQFKEKEKKLREKIGKFIEQKKQIRAQNFKPQRNTNKGQQQNKHDTFRSEIDEVKELREKLAQVKKQRNEKRDRFAKLIEEVKQTSALIKQLGGKSKGSKQTLSQKLQELQHRLMTASLSKDEEKNLNTEITLLKRKMKDAETVGNIEFRIEKARERKQQLDHEIQRLKEQKEPLQNEYKEIKEILDKKNAIIDGLKKQLDTDKKNVLEEKEKNSSEWEKWKEAKKKRLDDTEQKIKKIHEEIDKLWVDFGLQKEAYWKQKHYVDWIEWQMKVKSRKVNEIEREKRKLEYEKKEKQFEQQEKLQKYIGEIELCNQLIQYLNNIKDDYNRSQKANLDDKKQAIDVSAKLAADSQWKKEKVEVMVSKKSQVEEEAPAKKGKKNKNKNQQKKEEQKTFNIPFNVQNQFESLRVLAPSSIEQVDKKIEELRERERLFERGCKEEQVSEAETKLLDEIKNRKTSSKQGEQKKIKAEQDFPTI